MQFRRMSSTNLMRFAVASFEPMTVIISVVQTTGLSFLTGGKYMEGWETNNRPQTSGFRLPVLSEQSHNVTELRPHRESVVTCYSSVALDEFPARTLR